MLRIPEIWAILQAHMPAGEWLPLDDIYAIIERNATLGADDFKPQAPRSHEPKWKRNVRNVLQARKQQGLLDWDHNASYRLPALHPDTLEQSVAADLASIETEEIAPDPFVGFEGGAIAVYINKYERDQRLRVAATRIHGVRCKGCGFDFEAVYGARGRGYIEVHHLKPVSTLGERTQVHPQTDMTVLCANCHRMVHRSAQHVLSLEELRALLRAANPSAS